MAKRGAKIYGVFPVVNVYEISDDFLQTNIKVFGEWVNKSSAYIYDLFYDECKIGKIMQKI